MKVIAEKHQYRLNFLYKFVHCKTDSFLKAKFCYHIIYIFKNAVNKMYFLKCYFFLL